jgi:uncharacterized membrane protein
VPPLVPFIPLIAAGVTAGATIYSTLNQPDAPSFETQDLTELSERDDSLARDAIAAEQKALKEKRQRGRIPRIQTSPLGAIVGSENLDAPTLFGGGVAGRFR